MATVETRERPTPEAGLVYDGFISYSHAADDLLAPRLQAGLQRFAKPWWKRRALRMFRDESSLSANPHLWSSITDALDTSEWFVLLLSPDAAESEWVNQEIEYWLEHKDAERIIPVVTDGEFRWAETDIDLESDAVPPALYGAFSDEPRWVDLRFARSEEQLDLNNPRFSAAVADIASAIRQVPKDELESEEVRQHRRTVRTAWAAGLVVLLLAVLAGAAALFALDQRNDAVQQAKVAQARELTLEAEKVLELDPELSMHLALNAVAVLEDSGEDPVGAVTVLRQAIAEDRVVLRVPGGVFAEVHPNGKLFATADARDPTTFVIRDVATGEVVERYTRPASSSVDSGGYSIPQDAAFSPDGDLVAVAYGEEPGLTIWDRTSGDSFHASLAIPFAENVVFHPDGDLVAVEWQTLDDSGIELRSLPDLALAYETGPGAAGVDISGDGLVSYLSTIPDEAGLLKVEIFDPQLGEVIGELPVDLAERAGARRYSTQWSPDGLRIAAGNSERLIVLDHATGAATEATDIGRAAEAEWLDDTRYAIGGELPPRVVDAADGSVLIELVGLEGGTSHYDLVPGRQLLAVASDFGGETVLFDVSGVGGTELGGWETPFEDPSAIFIGDGSRALAVQSVQGPFFTANSSDGSDRRGGEEGDGSGFYINDAETYMVVFEADGTQAVWEIDTGEVIYRAPDGWDVRGVSPSGDRIVINNSEDCNQIRLLDPDGSFSIDLAGLGIQCLFAVTFSPAGDFGYIFGLVFDPGTGRILFDIAEDDVRYAGWSAVFTDDGEELIVLNIIGSVVVLDWPALRALAPPGDAVIREIAAHDAFGNRVVVSPDGSMFSSSSWNEPVKLWDRHTGEPLGEFGGNPGNNRAHWHDFHPTLPHLIVASPDGAVRVYTLDLKELMGIAETKLSRDMTNEECTQYFRGPCP